MAGPEIETRRPREGRCERCDRPLTDEVLVAIRPDWWEWRADDPDDRDDVCPGTRSGHRQRICFGTPVDWRARALAAAMMAMETAEAPHTPTEATHGALRDARAVLERMTALAETL